MSKEKRLAEIRERVEKATPGPWNVGFLDDEMFMNAVVIQTRPFDLRKKSISTSDGGVHKYENRRPGRWRHDLSDEELESIIGCTLLQAGHHRIGEGTELWDENADFIAHAREDVPWLLAEVERLQEVAKEMIEQKTENARLRERLEILECHDEDTRGRLRPTGDDVRRRAAFEYPGSEVDG